MRVGSMKKENERPVIVDNEDGTFIKCCTFVRLCKTKRTVTEHCDGYPVCQL